MANITQSRELTQEVLKAECEPRFQGSGGSKVVIISPCGWGFTCSSDSASKALRLANPGERVAARRKVRGEHRYHWVLVGTAT
jgi:hypothetical protein